VSLGALPQIGPDKAAERTRYFVEWHTKMLFCKPVYAVTRNSDYTATFVTTTQRIMNWRMWNKALQGSFNVTCCCSHTTQRNSKWWAPWRHTLTLSRRSLLSKRHTVSRHKRNVIYVSKKCTNFSFAAQHEMYVYPNILCTDILCRIAHKSHNKVKSTDIRRSS
jgi:hypothetical protein